MQLRLQFDPCTPAEATREELMIYEVKQFISSEILSSCQTSDAARTLKRNRFFTCESPEKFIRHVLGSTRRLALVPRVCQRKPKQVEIHLLPTYWKLLALLRGQNSTAITSSAGGSNSLNSSIHVLTTALYAEFGSTLLDRASSSSMVTPKNLQMLRELCTNIDAV